MKALAILGPRSRKQHLTLFQAHLPDLKVLTTPAEDEVRAGLEGAELALVLGGDGTLHRHLNALVAAKVLTVPVPSGSGNDFAAVNGIRSAENAAGVVRDFLDGKLQPVWSDLGLVRTETGKEQHFSCCANVGLDADATRRANALPAWLKSKGGYLLGGLGAILSYVPQRITVTRGNEVMFDERGWFVAVTNTPIYGGGLPIAPRASIFDGELDVTCLRQTPRWNVVRHYPKILSGAHTRLAEILAFRAIEIRIETERRSPIFSDGDYLGETPCSITLTPKSLQILSRIAESNH